jgi:cytochrome c biogenesis factor
MKPNTVLYVCATIIVVSLIASGTILTQTGHSSDVRSFAVLTAQGVLAATNLFGISLHAKSVTKLQTAELEDQIPKIVANGSGGSAPAPPGQGPASDHQAAPAP